jgi:ABC-type Fe3+ transport system substrate-binding protein
MFVNSPAGAREKGEADVGTVWTTEMIEARKHDRKIDGVAISAPPNKADKIGSAIDALSTGRNGVKVQAYHDYLATDVAQVIHASRGFVPAAAEKPKLKPILQNASSELLRN